MKLLNSLTNKIEEISPIEQKTIRMYSCGPTVYNYLHIGNLSAFIYADMIRRALQFEGYSVIHVMNITDVDDKTIRDSKRDYPDDDPKRALQKLTTKYTDVFMEDLAATGNDIEAITFISAVETIPEMIELVQRIIDNGFGYHAEDGIYFSISAYTAAGHPYGLLQHVNIQKAQSRVAHDEYDKESASDFALWKAAAKGEPSWNALFEVDGKSIEMPGRPGWHIECSAMSEKLLNVPFDLHTGGIDLKFPHHENEIAQSCGAGAENFANYFVHNNHILVDGRKMSKSLGNFYTLRDIEEKGFHAQDFRMVVLEGKYRNESNFTWESLQAAQLRLKNWQASIDTIWQYESSQEEIDETALARCLSDDLNTPKALHIVDAYFQSLQSSMRSPTQYCLNLIHRVFGLHFESTDISEDIKTRLAERAQAKQSKDWALADTIRDELKTIGYGINDTKNGQVWYRL